MSLTVVSTPIGNYGDITLRAIESLKSAEAIVCEEMKPAKVLLKRIGVEEAGKDFWQLNEHSKSQDVEQLTEICRTKKVCLISDCGTPGFCDPGAALVDVCLKEKIPVDVNPGASSLMALLAIAGAQVREFHFIGFLPAEKVERQKKAAGLKSMRVPYIIMDTPYRLQATLEDLARETPATQAVLGIDLTGEMHRLERGTLKELASKSWPKAPFVILVRP